MATEIPITSEDKSRHFRLKIIARRENYEPEKYKIGHNWVVEDVKLLDGNDEVPVQVSEDLKE